MIGWIAYNKTAITGLVCDECVTPTERTREGNLDSGILKFADMSFVCVRCGNEVAS